MSRITTDSLLEERRRGGAQSIFKVYKYTTKHWYFSMTIISYSQPTSFSHLALKELVVFPIFVKISSSPAKSGFLSGLKIDSECQVTWKWKTDACKSLPGEESSLVVLQSSCVGSMVFGRN
jgi:hypothetical protein